MFIYKTKKSATCLILLLCYAVFNHLYAQQYDAFIAKSEIGSVRFLDLEIIDNEFLYLSGLYHNDQHSKIWKYDLNGNVIDSLMLDTYDRQGIYLIEPHNDSILLYGAMQEGNNKQVLILCIDKQLNILWERKIDIWDDLFMLRFRTFQHQGYTYIHYNAYAYSCLIKLDEQYHLIDKKYFEEDLVSSDPIYTTDSGFVFSTSGNRVNHIDTTLNISWTKLLEGNIFGLDKNGIQNLGQDGYFTSDAYSDPPTIRKTNSSFSIIQSYPYFGNDSDDRFCDLRNFAINTDTTIIYAAGFTNFSFPAPVFLGGWESNEFWIARFTRDSLLWYNYYDDGNYYYPINMEVGADNTLYLASARYNVDSLPDYTDAVILKISPDGDIPVGINETNISGKKPVIYPNPGDQYITIEFPGKNQATFHLYNMKGQQVKTAVLHKQERVSATSLPPGIYFYRIVTTNGQYYTGKWIKE